MSVLFYGICQYKVRFIHVNTKCSSFKNCLLKQFKQILYLEEYNGREKECALYMPSVEKRKITSRKKMDIQTNGLDR